MKESVAIEKGVEAKKDFSPTNTIIPRVLDEPEMQLYFIRGVIGNIRRDGSAPSVESIATQLSVTPTRECAPAILALQQTHGNRYVQRVVSGIQAKLKVGQPDDKYEQEADRGAEQVMRRPEPWLSSSGLQPLKANSYHLTYHPKQRKMKTHSSDQKRTASRANANSENIFQIKIKKEPFFNPERSENDFFSKKASFLPTPFTLNTSPIQKKENKALPEEVQIKMESTFGEDFSNVSIREDYYKVKDMNALAFTKGESIHFAPGQFNPNSQKGQELIGHEFAHVQQQRQGRVQPIINLNNIPINTDTTLENEADKKGRAATNAQPIGDFSSKPPQLKTIHKKNSETVQFSNYYTVQTTRIAYIRENPSTEHLSLTSYHFMADQDLSLIGSTGEFVQVRGEAYEDVFPVREITGWIYKADTNLAPSSSASEENLRAAQDLDDMLDEHVLPAIGEWEISLRVQGNAYLTAYRRIEEIFNQINRDAQEAANRMGAVLTVVCVGPLGFLGDLAKNAASFANMFKKLRVLGSEAARGSLEDTIQTAIGEEIDIAQGGWFTNLVNSSTHPTEYRENHLIQLIGTT